MNAALPENPDPYGRQVAPETIRFQRELPGPIRVVWDYIVNPLRRGEWLAPGRMELIVEGRVELLFRHEDLTLHPEPAPERYSRGSNIATGRVTRLAPPTLISFTWNEESGRPSEVTFELAALGGGSLLTVTHEGLSDWETLVSVAAGWHTHLDILSDKMNGSDPAPFWSKHARLEAEYERRLATSGGKR